MKDTCVKKIKKLVKGNVLGFILMWRLEPINMIVEGIWFIIKQILPFNWIVKWVIGLIIKKIIRWCIEKIIDRIGRN